MFERLKHCISKNSFNKNNFLKNDSFIETNLKKKKQSIIEFTRNTNFALGQKTVFNCSDFMVKYKSLGLKAKHNA